MYVLGIDPGADGGACLISVENRACIEIIGFKKLSERKRIDWFDELPIRFSEVHAYLEKVHGWSKHDSARNAFKFGDAFGSVRTSLVSNRIPFTFVDPKRWQIQLGLGPGRFFRTKTDRKNAHKQVAQRLYPEIKMTHAIADAVCIAEYGRQMME